MGALPLTTDQFLASLRSFFYQLQYNATRLENLIRGVVGGDQILRSYFTAQTERPPGMPPALFDIVSFSTNRLYVFTAYQGSQVGSAVLGLRKLETIVTEEDDQRITVIFGFGSGNSVRISESVERSADLLHFANDAGNLAWR